MGGQGSTQPAPRAGRRQAAPKTPQVRLLCSAAGRADHHPLPWSEQEQRGEGRKDNGPWGGRMTGGCPGAASLPQGWGICLIPLPLASDRGLNCRQQP